jgi:hypothetical protein
MMLTSDQKLFRQITLQVISAIINHELNEFLERFLTVPENVKSDEEFNNFVQQPF